MDTGSGASMSSESVAEAFAELVEITVGEYDVHELLQGLVDRCVGVLDVAASGLLVANGDSGLKVMVASDERAQVLELFQIQHDEGPCLDCFRSGEAIVAAAPNGGLDRWPRFAGACLEAGFSSVAAVPMRVNGTVFGGLNLFGTAEQPSPNTRTARVAQAMAKVAAISIEKDRISDERATLIKQLESALESRVAIEQAKGILANHLDIDPNEAFGRLRQRARNSRRLLKDVATDAINNGVSDYTASGD